MSKLYLALILATIATGLLSCGSNKSVHQPNGAPSGPGAPSGLEEVVVYGITAGHRSYEPEPALGTSRNRDKFESFKTNPIVRVAEEPVSTFSSDVDTASYSYVRQRLNAGYLPDSDAVRLEEMVNYFDYDYPLPANKEQPFEASVVVHDAPWAKNRKLIHIGIQGYELEREELPDSNLVFLLDVSGSMNEPNKLPLVKQSMRLLLDTLKPSDTIAIAVYAGAAGMVLPSTKVSEKSTILNALNKLSAGGSTAGGEGIKLAYQLAKDNFKENAVNRIILATDGDFNVGISGYEKLKRLVEHKRKDGIFLSILGFGQGNYQDHWMQALAQNGNGIAAYIDTLGEAQKVLVHEATSALFPIANDLKFQIEFNPSNVKEYRLLGYETRALKQEDFNNDKVDAGDIGSGHSVTAIYEVVLSNSRSGFIDDLRYQPEEVQTTDFEQELAFVKIRYKHPDKDVSELQTFPIYLSGTSVNERAVLVREANFSAAVAGFAQLLRDDKYLGKWTYDDALALAQKNKGSDDYGYRSEFIQLIRKAKLAQPSD